jgi:hypothetical protein
MLERPAIYTNRLQCAECGRVSRDGERGWTARLTIDDEVVVYRELGFITLTEAAEIAREHGVELDVDGPTREEWNKADEPPRSFVSLLLGR